MMAIRFVARLLMRVLRCRRGAGALEHVLLLALLGVAALWAVSSFGARLPALLNANFDPTPAAFAEAPADEPEEQAPPSCETSPLSGSEVATLAAWSASTGRYVGLSAQDWCALTTLNVGWSSGPPGPMPAEVCRLTKITYLDLSKSPQGTLPSCIRFMPSLQNLQLLFAQLTSLPRLPPSLDTLGLQSNYDLVLPDTFFAGMVNLMFVNLADMGPRLFRVPPSLADAVGLAGLQVIPSELEPLHSAICARLNSNGADTTGLPGC